MENPHFKISSFVELQRRAQAEPAFLRQLQDEPHAVLAEYVGPIDREIEIRVVQDSDETKYLHIASPPPQGEVNEHDLMRVQGGTTPVCIGASVISALSLVSVSAQSIAQTSLID
ncbi:hypothetical protein Q5Y75_03335 [Ruegeria sp. 2205SS24-7]|uniref:hypothetical protein n=1 Tax=Ruegeria discodermiae TaxID=3064389 RepID=UPI0027427B4E|nr:hypothetical protein [Ruegeria sp. 2205SS24-7]MDP5216239.1 hypothetical protein [Ruegeria sp. 2205SS24-7]